MVNLGILEQPFTFFIFTVLIGMCQGFLLLEPRLPPPTKDVNPALHAHPGSIQRTRGNLALRGVVRRPVLGCGAGGAQRGLVILRGWSRLVTRPRLTVPSADELPCGIFRAVLHLCSR